MGQRDVLLSRVTHEHACPESKVVIEYLDAGAYRVRACGGVYTYSCQTAYPRYSPPEHTCTREAPALNETGAKGPPDASH